MVVLRAAAFTDGAACCCCLHWCAAALPRYRCVAAARRSTYHKSLSSNMRYSSAAHAIDIEPGCIGVQHRVTAEIDRLCSMYDEAHDMAPIAPVAAPVAVYSDQYGYPMPRVPQSSWGPSKSDDRRSSAVRGSAVRTQQPSSTRNDASDPDGTFSSRNDGPPVGFVYE